MMRLVTKMRSIIVVVFLLSSTSSLPVGDISASASINSAPFSNLGDIANQQIAQVIQAKTLTVGPAFPDSGRTAAVLEQDSGISKIDTAYGNLQQFVAGFFGPKPIVDTIQEHEKYGNDGDKFRSISTAVIGGIEGISNVLNAAVEVPFEAAKQFGRKITTSLNSVGGKIVGLRR